MTTARAEAPPEAVGSPSGSTMADTAELAPLCSAPTRTITSQPVTPLPVVVEQQAGVAEVVETTAPPPVIETRPPVHGARHVRRRSHRRLVREQIVILLVIVAALVFTVALLADQWLRSASVTGLLTTSYGSLRLVVAAAAGAVGV